MKNLIKGRLRFRQSNNLILSCLFYLIKISLLRKDYQINGLDQKLKEIIKFLYIVAIIVKVYYSSIILFDVGTIFITLKYIRSVFTLTSISLFVFFVIVKQYSSIYNYRTFGKKIYKLTVFYTTITKLYFKNISFLNQFNYKNNIKIDINN